MVGPGGPWGRRRPGYSVDSISEPRSRVLIGALLGLLLSAMANPRWFERYVDFPILLVFAGLSIVAGSAITSRPTALAGGRPHCDRLVCVGRLTSRSSRALL